MLSAIQFLVYVICRALLAVASVLPLSITHGIARCFGKLFYLILARRRRMTLQNIDRAFGDTLSLSKKKYLARTSFENVALSIGELLSISKVLQPGVPRLRLEGREHVERAYAGGKGVIVAISHLGSWEYLSLPVSYLTNTRWSVIVKSIHNPYLDRWINNCRRKTTVNPIYNTGSIKEILRELKANHGVAILIDQWAGKEGIWVEFFGEPTSTTSIPARLAAGTGAALLPVFCIREGNGRYLVRVLPVVPSDSEFATTRQLNAILEAQIRLYPEQWTWGHRRWRAKPAAIRESTDSAPPTTSPSCSAPL